eukprot:TRINITY_DN16124_c0_g1_i1.p1 TRINITY_DN16124_c0_g1~~TRINITY_DN16124_c0_g1_i1.p1  ORF type:complete len:103 (-),score=1.77 TRINITY_DN16124_c0_g1_i1:65-373(-)
MIEEAALGDAGFADDLIQRGAGEAFVQHRVLGDVEQAFAGLLAFAQCLNLNHLVPFACSTRSSKNPYHKYCTRGALLTRSSLAKVRTAKPVTRVTSPFPSVF